MLFTSRLFSPYSLHQDGLSRVSLEDQQMIYYELKLVCHTLMEEVEVAYADIQKETSLKADKAWYNPTQIADKIIEKISETKEAMELYFKHNIQAKEKLMSIQDILNEVIKP